MNDNEVLAVYARAKCIGASTDNSESELHRRNLFTQAQWKKIKDRNVEVGDPSVLVAAAWGEPSETSSSETALGRFDYWDYRGADKRSVTMHEWKVVSIDRFN